MNEQDVTVDALTRRCQRYWYMLEIGPGGHPTPWDPERYTSIDITAPGSPGTAGSEAGVICTASLQGSMESLPFAEGSKDIIVARHVLEHHADTLTVLREWARVLRGGGYVIIITPDQESLPGNTIHLDPTHRAAFTPAQLAALVGHAGFIEIEAEVALPQWSLLVTARTPTWEEEDHIDSLRSRSS